MVGKPGPNLFKDFQDMTEQETALRDQAIAVNQKLLDAIMGGEWTTYETLCD